MSQSSLTLIFMFLIIKSNFLISQVDPKDLPNIILIVADDMGWNDVSYHGSEIETPMIDSLAKNGVELNRFYVNPTCSPTRASLMTGKAALRLGVLNPFGKNYRKGLPLTEKILPQYLKDRGYSTSLVGKWHLGRFTQDYWPNNRGFDHFYGYLTGGIGHYNHIHGGGHDWQRNGVNLREEGYSTHLLTAEAVKLIKEKPSDEPMFLEVCYAAPHLPNEAPQEAINQYQHIADENRRLHAAMVSEVDRGVQRIIETLDERGILNNSIVWFTSDNGGLNRAAYPANLRKGIEGMVSVFGTPLPIDFLEFFRTNLVNGAADNTPFRRGKASIYEGGVRVPSFIYAPGLLQSTQIDVRLTITDVLPTLMDATGLDRILGDEIDGASQWNYLTGSTDAATSSDYIIHAIDAEAYYRDQWKLIVPNDGPHELYQILDDPTEISNIITDHPDIAQSLYEAYMNFPRGEPVDDPMWKTFMDMDQFGGAEDRAPYAGLEGVNEGPLHPIHYVGPIILWVLIVFFWWRRSKKKKSIKSKTKSHE